MPDFEKIQVKNRETFIDFIKMFQDDLENKNDEWENKTLKDFLEAMARYTEDIQGYYDNTGQLEENAEHASWKRFADILKGARVYE